MFVHPENVVGIQQCGDNHSRRENQFATLSGPDDELLLGIGAEQKCSAENENAPGSGNQYARCALCGPSAHKEKKNAEELSAHPPELALRRRHRSEEES